MIRRPRFPLALRLAWVESEIDSAAKLAHMLVTDMKQVIRRAEGVDAKLLMLATVCSAAVLPLGVNPRTLEAFVEQLGPDGDLAQAETLAAEIIIEVMTALSGDDGDDEGGPHH